jgi:hypothetical protein
MLPLLCDDVRRRVEAALEDPALTRAADGLDRERVDAAMGQRLVADISEHELRVRDRILALRASIGAAEGSLERLLLLRAALDALPRIASLPVSDDVQRLFYEAFDYVAVPPRGAAFDAARGRFIALCKLTSLRRFPAGQFHWEMSGVPRSWLLKARGRDRWTLLWWMATRFKGFGPVFFIHVNANRKNRHVLTEQEADRSYFRMARSIALQPEVKGLVASSWLNSPDTSSVSPHLEWMNRTFKDNGALVVTIGPADPDCGVLTRSPERKKGFEAGTFKPTVGLVIWPRDAMLAWAAAHPDFANVPEPFTGPPKGMRTDAIAGHAG